MITLRAESPSIFLDKSRKIEGDSAGRVHRYKKLSNTILNTFENQKVIFKILVHSSVIDIKQTDVIFFAMIITSGLKRFAKGA